MYLLKNARHFSVILAFFEFLIIVFIGKSHGSGLWLSVHGVLMTIGQRGRSGTR
jgi:hypothetical protein